LQGLNGTSQKDPGAFAEKTLLSKGDVKATAGPKKQKKSWFAKLFCASTPAAK
jgi:hypothetical protein